MQSKHQPQSILVTGGAGFIGSNFIKYILQTDSTIRVINLDLLTYAGSIDNLSGLPDSTRYTFVEGDICNQNLVRNIFNKHNIDTIVHFAAESHVDRSIDGPATFVTTNVLGTFTLLECAKEFWGASINGVNFDKAVRFHHISTDEVFGELSSDDKAFTEDSCYLPSSPYSASKASSDHFVRAYQRTYGLPATITNCSNNYGPNQNWEKFIPTIIKACVEETAIPVYGDGSNVRDWLYVEDHCRGIDAVLRYANNGETYNIGGNTELSNNEVVQKVCSVMDECLSRSYRHQELISFVKDRPGHDIRYAMDASRIGMDLNWFPQEQFVAGIRKTVNWYIERAQSARQNNLDKTQ